MSRCSVCDHERREAIERHLAEGTSLRVVAKATGISKDALYRHQKNHNVRELSAVADRIASGAADGDQGLGDLISSLQLAFEVALQKGDLSHVATLSRELRAAYVEMGKDAARRELHEFGRGGGGPVELHVVFDDPEMTDEEAGVLARVLARFGLDGSDPDAIAKLDIATRRLEGAIEHPALPEPTTAHHGDGDERMDSDAAGNEPEP